MRKAQRFGVELEAVRRDVVWTGILEGTLVSNDGTAAAVLVGMPRGVDRSALVRRLRELGRAGSGGPDEVLVVGRVRGVKANEAWGVGDLVGWDANGNPAVGDPASGCWTNVRTNWDPGYQGGVVEVAAAAGDELGIFDLSGQLRTARGQHTTVAASDTVLTGLTKVVSVVASLDSDPTDNPMLVSASIGDQAGEWASPPRLSWRCESARRWV